MAQTPGEIEDQIRQQREALNSNIDALEQKVKSATDWRQRYRKSPGLFLAAAAGSGLIVALMTRPRKVWVSQTPPPPRSVASQSPEVAQSVGVIKSALIGVAANEAKSLLSKWIPGFEHEYAKRKPAGKPASPTPESTSPGSGPRAAE